MRGRGDAEQRRIVVDSGGLSALCDGSASARHLVEWLRASKWRVEIPTVILAESTSGDAARDARVNHLLGLLERMPHAFVVCDERIARRAGKLRHAARSDDGIDSIVAAVAVGDGSRSLLLTSDPTDLGRLLSRNKNVEIVRV